MANMNKIKTCPVNKNHTTEYIDLGPSLKYVLCKDCKEDVDWLAKQNNQTWDEEQEEWSAQDAEEDDYEDNHEDDDFNDYEDEEDDDFGNAVLQQPAFNPRPVRVMGQGQKQIVLHNNPNSGAHHVAKILMRAFGKDAMEAQYIMMDAHYHGRAACFNVPDDVEGRRLLDLIEVIKTDLENEGGPGCDVIKDISFTIEDAP